MVQLFQVVGEHLIDQFGDACAAGTRHHDIDLPLDDFQRVFDGGRGVAQLQKCFVVFGVADAHRVVMRQPELAEGRAQARSPC